MNGRRKVTMSAIAHAVGVSHTCVSQVLNEAPNARISAITRRRIVDEANRRGYVQARRKDTRSASIAFVSCSSSFNHAAFSWTHFLLLGLQQRAAEDDRDITFYGVISSPIATDGFFRMIDKRRPLGVVLDGNVSEVIVNGLDSRHIPFVIVGTTSYAHDPEMRSRANTVSLDVEESVRATMKWFYDCGARRISLSVGSLEKLVHSLIYDSYRQAIDRLGLEYDPSLVQIGLEAPGVEIIERLGRLGIQYDAILLGSAARASRVLPYLIPPGRQVSRDRYIGVYGPVEWAREFPASVTVAGSSYAKVAEAAYLVLADELRYARKHRQHIVIPSEIRVGTTAQLK